VSVDSMTRGVPVCAQGMSSGASSTVGDRYLDGLIATNGTSPSSGVSSTVAWYWRSGGSPGIGMSCGCLGGLVTVGAVQGEVQQYRRQYEDWNTSDSDRQSIVGL